MYEGETLTYELKRIPPQGKRKESIVITVSGSIEDDIGKNAINEFILRSVLFFE